MSRPIGRKSSGTRCLAILLSAAISLALLSSCSPAEKTGAKPEVDVRTVDAMSGEAKRSHIASSFPLEVPVADGEIVRGEAQSTSAWNYELVVDAAPGEVSEWYVAAFRNRGWLQVVDDGLDGPSVDLSFTKQSAQSRILISPEGDDTRIVGVLGLGTPILETQ